MSLVNEHKTAAVMCNGFFTKSVETDLCYQFIVLRYLTRITENGGYFLSRTDIIALAIAPVSA